MAVGQKDRLDRKPLLCEFLIDLPAMVRGIEGDRLALPFPVQVIEIGLDHADHITSNDNFLHRVLPRKNKIIRWFS